MLTTKGIAMAIADGISSSDVSHIASEAAVRAFLEDYYCTSEAWSVKHAAHKVIAAINSWLYAQTRKSQYRYEIDRGYVCTFSGIIFKSTTAHIFHAGDTRIYRLRKGQLQQLTEDHRLRVSEDSEYLSRALGMNQQMEVDYSSVSIEEDDVYLLSSDGVHEYCTDEFLISTIYAHQGKPMQAANIIVEHALQQGSNDNLTIQIAHIAQLPLQSADEIFQQLTDKPFPPQLEARMEFDGYHIIREIHITNRSHIFLAQDMESNTQVILKAPSVDMRDDPAYLERFLMEEWVARRINNAHILKPYAIARPHNFIYTTFEYIEGQTLAQWMMDNPVPDLETVRDIVEQIAKGLRAFHRQEMLHQDLRPNNVMIDKNGTVKIIDFGSTRVAGLVEIESPIERQDLLGTALYTAPEYFLGESGSEHSDQFSLGVITYQMLSGRLPYGTQVARCRSISAQRKLKYKSVLAEDREIPAWVDEAIRRSVQVNRYKRYPEISEFIHDLRHPNKSYLSKTKPPLVERNPVLFWKGISLGLFLFVIYLLWKLNGTH